MRGGFTDGGVSGVGNEFVQALMANQGFDKYISDKIGALAKADTIATATNLLYYDLSHLIQFTYPYRELIPRISRLPRVAADGGNAFHWKRITGIGTNNVSAGVSEGNRGARTSVLEQDMMAAYKTLGKESSVTFEARLAGRNLSPEVLGISIQSALRDLRINEEKILINGNSSLPLGTTPTPTLAASVIAGITPSFANAAVYVACVALSGFAYNTYTPYSSVTGLGGIPGQVTKVNAGGQSTDTFGGGSARPSAIAAVTPNGTTQAIVATCSLVAGATNYAWYVGTTAGSPSTMYLAGITPSNQVVLTKIPPSTNQPLSALYVGGLPQDNSTNILVPDGVLTQILGAVTGPDPGRAMSTNPFSPSGVSYSAGGSIIYTMPNGNTGLTISGININEFDAVLQAAFEQYKVGFDRIMMSATDMIDSFGQMLNQASAANIFRMLFESSDGQIRAGQKVTSYLNKFMNNTLEVEVHPWLTPGTIIFWSDRTPYEVSNIANLLEAKVRQDYYQIQWPWTSRRYEYGVYVDETFPMYFTPAFAAIINKNPSSGNSVF